MTPHLCVQDVTELFSLTQQLRIVNFPFFEFGSDKWFCLTGSFGTNWFVIHTSNLSLSSLSPLYWHCNDLNVARGYLLLHLPFTIWRHLDYNFFSVSDFTFQLKIFVLSAICLRCNLASNLPFCICLSQLILSLHLSVCLLYTKQSWLFSPPGGIIL